MIANLKLLILIVTLYYIDAVKRYFIEIGGPRVLIEAIESTTDNELQQGLASACWNFCGNSKYCVYSIVILINLTYSHRRSADGVVESRSRSRSCLIR